MVCIHRIPLVDVGVEKLIVSCTLVVLEPTLVSALVFLIFSPQNTYVFSFWKFASMSYCSVTSKKASSPVVTVTFALDRTKVGLLDNPDCESDIGGRQQVFSDTAFVRI
jgi:hypothetical protein